MKFNLFSIRKWFNWNIHQMDVMINHQLTAFNSIEYVCMYLFLCVYVCLDKATMTKKGELNYQSSVCYVENCAHLNCIGYRFQQQRPVDIYWVCCWNTIAYIQTVCLISFRRMVVFFFFATRTVEKSQHSIDNREQAKGRHLNGDKERIAHTHTHAYTYITARSTFDIVHHAK